MRSLIFLLLALSGCTSVAKLQPYAVEVRDAAQLQIDINNCRVYALNYKRNLSVSAIGTQALKGGAQNLAGAAIQPYVPVLGAAGSGGAEALEELGLTDTAQQKVFIRCLYAKTDKDQSALVLEPMP